MFHRIWAGRRERPLAPWERLFYWLMVPFGTLYSSFAWARRELYRAGVLRSRSVPGLTVVSVGNITVGGTGKSPLTIALARGLMERDIPVAVVSRGYGAVGRGSGPLLVSDGTGPLVGPDRAGDEPVMIARSVPVTVIVSRDRPTGARLARDRYGARVVILDDGFQHRALARDADVVLLDGRDPFGNRWTLPAGPLREPLSALRDADLYFFVYRGLEGIRPVPDRLKGLLAAFNRDALLVQGSLRIQGLRRFRGGELREREWLKGRRVLLVSGIARPADFRAEVEGRGAEVADHLAYPDHHDYGSEEAAFIRERLAGVDAEVLLTTAKDEVKLIPAGLRIPEGREGWVAEAGYDPRSVDLLVDALAGLD
ncbi:MAG: tetraacyldisaccharide 4'-kinase [bacterium]